MGARKAAGEASARRKAPAAAKQEALDGKAAASARRGTAAPAVREAAEPGRSGGPRIGTLGESALHAALKARYATEGARLEALLEGKVVDVLRPSPKAAPKARRRAADPAAPRGAAEAPGLAATPADAAESSVAYAEAGLRLEAVEIQTRRLDKLVDKVLDLAEAGHAVRVVHPVAAETRILRLDPDTGELLSERRSPKRGDRYALFDELVMAPELVAATRVTVEVLLVRLRELRTRDGSGSWRKRGDRVLSRELEEVLEVLPLRTKRDWLRLLPKDLDWPTDSAALGKALGIPAPRARKILYTYARAGLLLEVGKAGRRKSYAPAR